MIEGLFPRALAMQLFDIVDPMQLLMGFLLIVTGFVLGLCSVVYLSGILTGNPERRLSLTEALVTDFPSGDWDPSEISPQPNTAGLASQEEHVIRLLIANEGRIRQSSLIDETGWSQAKVSRLLQEMETKGDISRIHVGRHNLVVLGRFPPLSDQRP